MYALVVNIKSYFQYEKRQDRSLCGNSFFNLDFYLKKKKNAVYASVLKRFVVISSFNISRVKHKRNVRLPEEGSNFRSHGCMLDNSRAP